MPHFISKGGLTIVKKVRKKRKRKGILVKDNLSTVKKKGNNTIIGAKPEGINIISIFMPKKNDLLIRK